MNVSPIPMSHFSLVRKIDGGFYLSADASETEFNPTIISVKSDKTGVVRDFKFHSKIRLGDGELAGWKFVDTVDSRNQVHIFND